MKTTNEMTRWMVGYHCWKVNEIGMYDSFQEMMGFGYKGFYNMSKKEITSEYRKLRKEAKLEGYKE